MVEYLLSSALGYDDDWSMEVPLGAEDVAEATTFPPGWDLSVDAVSFFTEQDMVGALRKRGPTNDQPNNPIQMRGARAGANYNSVWVPDGFSLVLYESWATMDRNLGISPGSKRTAAIDGPAKLNRKFPWRYLRIRDNRTPEEKERRRQVQALRQEFQQSEMEAALARQLARSTAETAEQLAAAETSQKERERLRRDIQERQTTEAARQARELELTAEAARLEGQLEAQRQAAPDLAALQAQRRSGILGPSAPAAAGMPGWVMPAALAGGGGLLLLLLMMRRGA